jgi:hypothetical protein
MSKVLSCMSRIGTTIMQSIRAVKIGRNTGPTHWPCILIWVRQKKNIEKAIVRIFLEQPTRSIFFMGMFGLTSLYLVLLSILHLF